MRRLELWGGASHIRGRIMHVTLASVKAHESGVVGLQTDPLPNLDTFLPECRVLFIRDLLERRRPRYPVPKEAKAEFAKLQYLEKRYKPCGCVEVSANCR